MEHFLGSWRHGSNKERENKLSPSNRPVDRLVLEEIAIIHFINILLMGGFGFGLGC